ncbi:unnamed protein product, partial [Rotaria magnacalcarata]
SDEDDELENNKALDNHIEKKILSLDINASHSIEQTNNTNLKSTSIPSWINDQVYGDK